MPFDGSGNFDRVHNWTDDRDAAIKVRADRFDAENDDFAAGFENCLTKDNQVKPTVNIDFNAKKITNLADATALKDALNLEVAQNNEFRFGITAGAANAYTLSLVPTSAGYGDGLFFFANIHASNTGASTLNLDTHGVKNLRLDGQALTGAELIQDNTYLFAYNLTNDVIDIVKPQNATETLKGILELATSAETITGTDLTRGTHPKGVSDAIDDKILNATITKTVKITKAYTDFATAGTTNTISGYILPSKTQIVSVEIRHTTAFSGGAISAYTVGVGITGALNKLALNFDVFQATGNEVAEAYRYGGSLNYGATTDIKFTAISTGANLDQAVAGSVDIYLILSTLE
jgi:hypothetical protein